MAKRKILTDSDPALRQVCKPVEKITPRIETLLDDMIETMRDANGVGLAGPQVGVLRRIVVIEVEEGKVLELINPKIIAFAGEQEGLEGCLSLPGEVGTTCRPASVRVQAQDRNGKWCVYTGEDLKARCFCHEIDHLDGIVFTQRVIKKENAE